MSTRDAIVGARPVVVVVLVGVVLLAERATAGAGVLPQQVLLGVPTWLLLLALLRRETPLVRAQVGVVVVFATSIEYVYHLCSYLPALGLLTALLPDLESDRRVRGRDDEHDAGVDPVTVG